MDHVWIHKAEGRVGNILGAFWSSIASKRLAASSSVKTIRKGHGLALAMLECLGLIMRFKPVARATQPLPPLAAIASWNR
jgi:hypothetical protein